MPLLTEQATACAGAAEASLPLPPLDLAGEEAEPGQGLGDLLLLVSKV